MMPLPPYAPEQNSVENVWEYLRSNWFSHCVWDTYAAILDACCDSARRQAEPGQTGPIAPCAGGKLGKGDVLMVMRLDRLARSILTEYLASRESAPSCHRPDVREYGNDKRNRQLSRKGCQL
jgi:hypothetical protein